MNGFSREAFFAWWQKETVDSIGFVDQEHAAFHAWAAALEWYGRQLHTLETLKKGTDQDLPIDDLDEFSVYWWGPDVDGENSLAEAIESGQMGEFARAVLGHSPLTPAEIQLLKEGKCLQLGDYKIQLDGDFTTDAILRIAATLKGENPTVPKQRVGSYWCPRLPL